MMSNAYAQAGVSVEAGYEAVRLMRASVESTYTKGVLGSFGGFGGLFEPDVGGMTRPVYVSGCDGVGTKLKLAFLADKHDTVGIDCVAMCANDVLCVGAKPLFFLDYIASPKTDPVKIAALVAGVAAGCREAGAALLGGETAELPGLYAEGEYDLAGFCVGVVDYDERIDGTSIVPGDVLVGLSSSGVHSNGFTLVRSLFPHPGAELLDTLLTPTRIYVRDVCALMSRITLKGLAHITGGGWIENIPRMLPPGLRAVMDKPSNVPEVFRRIQAAGGLSDTDMVSTFNMGLGMVACVAPSDAEASGLPVVGVVEEGSGGIRLQW